MHHEAPAARGVEPPHLLRQRGHRLVHDAPVAGLALGRVEQRADLAGERLLRDVVVGAAPDHEHDLGRLLHRAALEVALEVVPHLVVEAAGEEELRALLDRRDDGLARHIVVLHRRGAAVRLVLDREAGAVGEVVRPVRARSRSARTSRAGSGTRAAGASGCRSRTGCRRTRPRARRGAAAPGRRGRPWARRRPRRRASPSSRRAAAARPRRRGRARWRRRAPPRARSRARAGRRGRPCRRPRARSRRGRSRPRCGPSR